MPFADGLGRCGIYPVRPRVCAAYPATLVDGEVARRTDVLCPDGAWGPGSALASPAWRDRTARQYAELEIDALVNERWNAATPPPDLADALDAYRTWSLAVYERMDAAPGAPLEWTVANRAVMAALRAALDCVPPPGAGITA
jgi:hypothetical protein